MVGLDLHGAREDVCTVTQRQHGTGPFPRHHRNREGCGLFESMCLGLSPNQPPLTNVELIIYPSLQ